MTIRSTTPPTALLTGDSQPIALMVLALEVKGKHCRLRAAGAAMPGQSGMQEWTFAIDQLTGPLLNEIGAVCDQLAVEALLLAVGIQGVLFQDLLDASGAV